MTKQTTPAPPSRRRRSDADRSVAAILAAALDELARDPDASMAAIARRAGVVRATIYVHFPTRESLLDAVMEHAVAQVAQAASDADPARGKPSEALERVLRATWQQLDQFQTLLTINTARLSPRELHRRHLPVTTLFVPLIERGQKDGSFRRDVPVTWHLAVIRALAHTASFELQAGRIREAEVEDVLLTTVLAAVSGGIALRQMILLAGFVVAVTAIGIHFGPDPSPPATDGQDERVPTLHRPTIEAAFAAESYPRGSAARLISYDRATSVTIQLYRVGDSPAPVASSDEMRGTPMGPARTLALIKKKQSIRIGLDPGWPSGLYFAQLTAPGGRIGYAPFVLAPEKLGGHRIAVVLPTETWQAYNFRDDDGDGKADTWYADPEHNYEARLIRPFENRGVPPHYREYDETFLRWLDHWNYAADYLSDAELRRAQGSTLARAYDLLIFEGHHEYVTSREFDAVEGFRNLGGSLMFLSANNFFRKITIADHVMTLVGQYRKLGRPEATLTGARYFASRSSGRIGSPWVVRESSAGTWIFDHTGLEPGSPFGSGGIEVDGVSPASPPGTEVVAEIPNVFGDGRSAQMTYYEAPSGARVFSAGAFTLAGAVWQPPVSQMMINLIEGLSKPAEVVTGG